MATSRSVGNYSTSAKAVIRASDQIFDAAMSGKPDFTKISKEAIKGRSMERRAVTKAEGEVASAGLAAYTKAKRTQNAADTANEINGIKRPAKRMAGVVAGLGAIGGALMMNKNMKEDKAERDAFRAEQNAINQKSIENFNTQQEALNTRMAELESMLTDTGSTSSKNDGSGTTNTNSGSSSTSQSNSSLPVSSGSPGWQKLSRVIRHGEGTSGKDGYNTQFTGTQFTDMSAHPRQLRKGGGHTSDAAGAYQFLSTTWDGAKNALNLPDFSPESQEKAGRYLTQQRGVDPDKVFTNIDEFRSAMDKLAPEWASLPYSGTSPTGHGRGSSYYGQGGKDINALWAIYNQT